MSNRNLLTCEHCGEQFSTKKALNIHKAKSHAAKEAEQMRYFCSRCGAEMRSPKQQAEHIKSEHPEVVRKLNLIYWGITIVIILIVLWQWLN
jgi:DNA-directed RNA polymerase subunit RPC12/RpoP